MDMATLDIGADTPPDEPEDMLDRDGDLGGAAGGEDADMMQDVTTRCSAEDLDACRYTPARRHAMAPTLRQDTLIYQDLTGEMREVPFEVRIPAGLSSPAPVIVWSHGGSGGKSDASNVGVEWGEVFVKAGYVFVAMAHDRPSNTIVEQCEAFGSQHCRRACQSNADCANTPVGDGLCLAADQVCQFYKPLNWDRPHDFSQLLNLFEEQTPRGEKFREVMDLDRLIYAGHSAGAGSTMMISGAGRNYIEVREQLLDPRPVAFMSFSPQPVGEDGFDMASYDGSDCEQDQPLCLTRPQLVVTGVGDGMGGEGPNRREMFFTLPETQNRTLLYITEEAAQHTTFEHKSDACVRYARLNAIDTSRCSFYHTLMESMALAFADAILLEEPAASAYLASEDVLTLAAGAAEVARR